MAIYVVTIRRDVDCRALRARNDEVWGVAGCPRIGGRTQRSAAAGGFPLLIFHSIIKYIYTKKISRIFYNICYNGY